MRNFLRRARFHGLVLAIGLSFSPGLSVASESAIVARRTAAISGTIEGGFRLAGEGNVQVLANGLVTGDVTLPADKWSSANGNGAKVKSAKAASDWAANAVRGAVRVEDAFELPAVSAASRPVAVSAITLQGNVGVPDDLGEIGTVTVKHTAKSLILPPGAYGDFVIAQGGITLGVAGSVDPVRYEFHSLDVRGGAGVDIVGPVIVTLARAGVWRGRLGNSASPLWLDLRVAEGDVTIASGGEIGGFLSAPKSTVSVTNGGKISGGVIADQLFVEKGAKITEVSPDWNAAAGSSGQPRFGHKALRLQRALPSLKVNARHAYSPAVSYVEGAPILMLNESALSGTDTRWQQAGAFFQGCLLMIDTSGFERCGVVWVGRPSGASVSPGLRNVALTRASFETLVSAVGGRGTRANNLNALANSPRLQMEFMSRVLNAGGAK